MGNQKKLDRAKKNLSMPTPPLKKSALNFSPVEVDILLRQLDEQRHLLTGRVSNGTPLSASHIRQAWNKVAKEVSEVSSVARSGSDVREKWIDLQQRTRSKLAKFEKMTKSRGSAGGKHQLTPLEEKVFSLIDVSQVLGIDGMEEGLTLDKVDSKVRVEVDKLKEGMVKAMQKRKKSSEADMDSTPPASAQDGSQSPSDSDANSYDSDIVVIKKANGAKRSPIAGSKKSPSLPKPPSPEFPIQKSTAASNEISVNSSPTKDDPPVQEGAASKSPKVVKPAAISPVMSVASSSITNGVVRNSRKRIRVEEHDEDVEQKEEKDDEGDRQRRKRVRQQHVERVKSHTVAQKLADIELRRLEMERSFAERRLTMDHEMAEKRLAFERESQDRRLKFDCELQERKFRMQQEFCSRIVGTVEGLLQIYSNRQERNTFPVLPRSDSVPLVMQQRHVTVNSREKANPPPKEIVQLPAEVRANLPEVVPTISAEEQTQSSEPDKHEDATEKRRDETENHQDEVEKHQDEVEKHQDEVVKQQVEVEKHQEAMEEEQHDIEVIELQEEISLAADEVGHTSVEFVEPHDQVEVVEEMFVADMGMEEVIIETQADEK